VIGKQLAEKLAVADKIRKFPSPISPTTQKNAKIRELSLLIIPFQV
jgi:hypothetical protein